MTEVIVNLLAYLLLLTIFLSGAAFVLFIGTLVYMAGKDVD